MPRKRKHHELREPDIAALTLNPDAAREFAASRLWGPESSHGAHTKAAPPPSSAGSEQRARQPSQTSILPIRPVAPLPNRKRERLLQIIATAPGWGGGIMACLDRKFQRRYRAVGGHWLPEEPSEWDRCYLQALSRAVYFAKPAELNERLQRQLDSKTECTWLGLTTRDVLDVVDEMRAEKEADGQAQAVEVANQPGWTASLAFR